MPPAVALVVPRAVPPRGKPNVFFPSTACQSNDSRGFLASLWLFLRATDLESQNVEKQRRTLQHKLSSIFLHCRRPLTCFVLGPRRILEWRLERNAFKRISPKFTQCPKTELLGVILQRCNFVHPGAPSCIEAATGRRFCALSTFLNIFRVNFVGISGKSQKSSSLNFFTP